ncbi:Hint domain-containing protein [Jannaschia sp. S6380]|uniref:Hint domain-containing protein n=1 Tax=Jannaschia sp. S6380 TaxID=2926408 RepID=UPI00248C8DB1|nr:Hint domain-containing protein [Jannaschia sp. S6380]
MPRKGGGLHPVHIDPGVIGNHRRIRLSPQHRVVVRVKAGAARRDVFVSAKHLAEEYGGTIRSAEGIRKVEFFNLFLDRHEVILAEGAQVESLYPGPETKKVPGLDLAPPIRAQHQRLLGARTASEIERAYGPPAREVMNRRELRQAIATGRLCLRPPSSPDVSGYPRATGSQTGLGRINSIVIPGSRGAVVRPH